ncbi:5' exonuclease Apollo [Carex littledalei]|uniref:5' exonuclease Apollo n=1 Tax=Carex littledalei TaxID=544730 RepID=A0A833RU45_9POAL|nr:5' exonuclease Apollo [Carex littledalei]
MSIEMPKGLPFAVDTWSYKTDGKRYHFLSHAHRDHLKGIESRASYPIYATRVTINIVLNYYPQLDEAIFVEIKVGETLVINDADGDFSVTVCDANHCSGAIMFIFEGIFGNILHTGDCRLTPDCLLDLQLKYVTKRGKETVSRFDFIFLDCTFGGCFLKFPTKESAIQQVINCIWKHPHAPLVYLACDLLGHEEILIQVSRTFGSKIYVDQSTSPDFFNTLALIAPHVISNDPSSRFQVIRFKGLYERARETLINAQNNHQPTPLFIRPSTQWYAIESNARAHIPSLTESEQDDFGLWHVCFSMHSSREELELALQLLQPKWVISTTPSSLAMELSYVKNHCFGESEIKTMAGEGVWQIVSSLCPRFPDNWYYEGHFDDEELFPMSIRVLKELCQGRDPSSIPLPLRAVLAGAPTTRLTKEQLIHYVPPTQLSQTLITTAGEQLNQSLPLTIAEPQVDRAVTPHGDKRVSIKQSTVQQDKIPLDDVNSSNNSGKEGRSCSADEAINL